MKTFKLITFDMLTQEGIQSIPLIDAIIINQENSQQTWILELFLTKEYQPIFENSLHNHNSFEARVVISFPDNEPAHFNVAIYQIKEIGNNISVLLKGSLLTQRRKYASQLLEKLLKENLSHEELLTRFERGMKIRPTLKND